MDEHELAGTGADAEEVAVARLRAADPAAAAEPDVVALRAAVEERRVASPPDELAARRLRRLTTWPARAAAVAAAALVVGGAGGYVVGTSGGDDDGGGLTAEPPIVLQGPGDGDEMATESAGGAPVAPSADVARAGDAAFGWYGRTVFRSAGLSADGGTATGWGLDASAVSADAAAAAAATLGVAGEPRLEWGSLVVGPADGSGPTLQLSADGAGSVSYWDPSADVWSCVETSGSGEVAQREAEAAREGGADDAGAGIEPVAPEPCTERDLGDAPSGDAATGRVRDAMTALGVDPSAFELVTEDYGDPAYVHVTAYHVVDGQRTGLAWSATFSGAGLTNLYGFTADLVELGEYDVVSPEEAVARLNDPRFGGGWSGPIIMAGEARTLADAPTDAPGAAEDMAIAPAPEEEPDGVPPAPAAPGSPIAWPVQEVTITAARLGVAQMSAPDGAMILAPTYELTGDDGSVWSVIAVAERHLDLAG